MDKREGYTISHGEDSQEVITLEGDGSCSMSRENAVRFTEVFLGLDIQYTMLNDTVKEDITGRKVIYEYGALVRLAKVTQADDTVAAYKYDAVGNLVKTTELGEAIYTYAYDTIKRLISTVNSVGITTFQYDHKGTVDGEENTNTYEYDEPSRLLSYTTPERVLL